MTAAIATLVLGVVIGYLGQRSRLCFISGYRDFVLMRDTVLLRGVLGAFLGAVIGHLAVRWLGGGVPGFPAFAQESAPVAWSVWILVIVGGLGVGLTSSLAGGCPYRMHVLAGEGGKTYWYYLGGFYAGLVFYNLVTGRAVDALVSLQ
jgi:hypothetical protein